MFEMFEALILGIVQGLTEFIPVSSSGHLVLFHELLGMDESGLAFDVALHVGTLLAVAVYFRKDIMQLIKGFFARRAQETYMVKLLIIATIPAVIAGLLLQDVIESSLRSPWVVVTMLVLFGGVMLLAESRAELIKKKCDSMSLTKSQGLTIGVMQACALVPGVSRSGATISAGLFLGLDRVAATRFSFLMALPVIFGASIKVLLESSARTEIAANPGIFSVGFLAAMLSGLIAIRFLLGFVARYSIRTFAYYRFVAAGFIALLLVVAR